MLTVNYGRLEDIFDMKLYIINFLFGYTKVLRQK